MHKCYNYTKIKKGEPNLEKLKNCLDKWGHYKISRVEDIYIVCSDMRKSINGFDAIIKET